MSKISAVSPFSIRPITLATLLAIGGGAPTAWAAADCTSINLTSPSNSTCVVPTGVTRLSYTVVGGNGGGYLTRPGGKGAKITGTLTVTPGATLYLSVGGNGTSAPTVSGGNNYTTGAGGGGYSSIATTSHTAGPVIVAGGGGGAMQYANGGNAEGNGAGSNVGLGGAGTTGGTGGTGTAAYGPGGKGGGLGEPGTSSANASIAAGGAGGGGFGAAGGSSGNVNSPNISGGAGGANGGGQGGNSYSDNAPAGGGGGGGYAGGGGGGQMGGGGGGSSLVPTGSTLVLGDGSPRIVLELAPPSLASSAPANSPAANVTSMDFTVTFSEAVSGVDANDFTLTATGTASGTIGTPTTSDNIVYTVPISGISGSGTLRLDLKNSGTGIAATAGSTAIAGGFTGGSVHNVATAPAATTSPASSVGQTGATLNGTVNDNGASTTVTFDYGADTSYGTNIAATTGGTVSAGAGSTAVATTLTGLTCNTTYHFRVKGVNNIDTTFGNDASFTTTACAVNGACGTSNGSSVSSTPTTNLCTTGKASAVSGTGPWNWTCDGSNGGSNASCSASVYVEPPPPPPPPISLPTGGGTGSVTSGGNTIVVTDNGTTGTTLTLGGGSNTPITNTVQLPGTGSVTVTNTGNATLTVSTSGNNGVLNVTSGSATVTATSSGQPLAMGNGLILVTANGSGASASVAASGSTPPIVNTGGNTTVTILGTPQQVAGATLQLVGGTGGGAPVTFEATTGATPVTLIPGSSGAVFTVQPVSSGDSQTNGLVVTSGSVTVSVPTSGGSTGFAVGGSPVQASGGAQLTVFGQGQSQAFSVGSGTITLPTSTATSRSSRAPSTERLPGGLLYAGETAEVASDGEVLAAYIGSPNADQDLTGDRLTKPVIEGLSISTGGVKLAGNSIRLNADLETTTLNNLQTLGFTRSSNPDSLGAFDVTHNGQTYRGMAAGRVSIDHRQADGFDLAGNGGVAMTRDGVTVTFVPAVSNLEALSAFVKAMGGSLGMSLRADGGYLSMFTGAHRYAVQPGYEVISTSDPEGLGNDAAGNITYTDPQGRKQTFYPTAADYSTLLSEARKLDAGASLTGNAAGVLTLTLSGQRFTMKPDIELVQAPQDKANQQWWVGSDGKIYVRVKNTFTNFAQGFVVE